MQVIKTYVALTLGLVFVAAITMMAAGATSTPAKFTTILAGFAVIMLPMALGFAFPRVSFMAGCVFLVVLGMTIIFAWVGIFLFIICAIPTIYYKLYPPKESPSQVVTR